MLPTQVSYWSLQENKRHNLVTESQTEDDLKRRREELNQTIRYNTQQVEYWTKQVKELTRHNKVTEKLSKKELKVKQKQAKASLMSAQAALTNAEVAVRDLDNKATQAKAALVNARTNASVASTTKALNKAKSKLTSKQAKYYDITNVVVPSLQSGAGLVKTGAEVVKLFSKKGKRRFK